MNYTHGNYITVSKDGTINFWTQDFELQKTEVSKNRETRHFSSNHFVLYNTSTTFQLI